MANRLISVDNSSYQFPTDIRERIADNIRDPAAVEGVAVRAITGPTVNVVNYGADPSGVSDSTSAINAAITGAVEGSRVIIPPGTYLLSGSISNAAKSVHVIAHGATFVQSAAQISVNFAGGWETTVSVSAATATTITEAGNTNFGVQLTVVGTMPWQRGDVVKVWSDNVIPGSQWDIPVPAASSGRVGQFFTVYSVALNTVVLQGKMRDPMTTGVKVARMLPVTCTWEGGTFDVSAGYIAGSYTTAAVRFAAMRGPEMRGVRVARAGGPAFTMNSNFGYRVENCESDWTWNDATTHFGYGVDDNTSEYGVVSGCRFFQPRHGYTTTASTTTVGQDAPNTHGRTYGTRVIDTIVDSATDSAYDTHSAGDSVSFENCVAVNAVYAFHLRGRNHRISGSMVRSCGTAVRLASDATAGESYGHTVDGLEVDTVSAFVVTARTRHGGGHPNLGVRDARTSTIRNITAINVTGQAIDLLNTTVVAENITVDYSSALTAAAAMSTIDNAYLYGRNLNFHLFNTTGTGAYLMTVTDTACVVEVEGLRVRGFSTMATRLAQIISAGTTNPVLRVSSMLLDYAPSGLVSTVVTPSGWVDFQVAVGGNLPSSAHQAMVDADVLSATTLNIIAKSHAPVQTIVVTLTGANRVLANLPTPLLRGQVLVIVNASAAFTLTVTHGATPKTSLTGAASKVLSASQSIMLVADAAGLWRQVTPV